MSYFLKKTTPSSKGVYLQIYESNYIPGKGKRNHSYKALGYVCDLISDDMPDPISHYQGVVQSLNEELNAKNAIQIGETSLSKNLGYFLPKIMFDYLDMAKDINIVGSTYKCHYDFYDMLKALCYAQIVNPGSKKKAIEKVIPNIYDMKEYTYDQVIDFVDFIGSDYHKYIEVLNKHIADRWTRNLEKTYFDCTNYYFEIDAENDLLRKGPSKENRHCPLLGQALLLDADQIPIDTKFYPGNQSEKPLIRERVEEMKIRNNITSRVIQVADKGLNCAQNIYSAVVEANDGYIFSKSIKGKSLSKDMKEWLLKEDNDLNIWHDVRNKNNELLYKYKEYCFIDPKGKKHFWGNTNYKFKNADGEIISFTVKEKNIVTYNAKLAAKQKREIKKQIEKARNLVTYKSVLDAEHGDLAKYINLEAIDQDGKKVKIASSINEEVYENDLKYAGYNLLCSSEINAKPEDIYKTYHNLWRIEESFRILKTYLEARPAYLSKYESLYGHFTICYIALTIMRLLELKVFEDELSIDSLFDFIRQYNATITRENSFINTSTKSGTYETIKKKLGISKLGNVYLSKRDIDNILKTELDYLF